jgi:hypothetical protein
MREGARGRRSFAAAATAELGRDERVRLPLARATYWGVESLGPSQLVGNLPSGGLQDAVAE